ncbi:lytic polysaccharide monooxygenase [Glycomyces arizonensis]|uniref:lytic polysaccharide monooxygenase n=1 Tax=Glycomyces arizonensis TaxID=256035 RepID=UPI000418C145|nr:lytic polysaccharide monooxygenase [Glycomyces arizonensis]
MRRTKRLLAVLSVFAAAVLSATMASPAWGHAYISDPPSRAANCASGAVSDCGAIQWEPQSVEGPKGFPAAGPADGSICAGGNSRFSELDDPRGGDWPATNVSPGSRTFTWTIKAAHATDKWEYFITRDGWNENQPLTRAALESAPIYTDYDGGARPPWSVTHNVNLPSKSGHHIILAVWTISDTANAFYSCIDVQFGGGGNDGGGGDDDPPPAGDCTAAAWSSSAVYNGGDTVTHNGAEWRAKWWTQGEEPGTTGDWGVWEQVGTC